MGTTGAMFFVLVISPMVLLGLMLVMERVERPLRQRSVTDDLEAFLDNARPDEVETFVSRGFAPAIEDYWSRLRPARRGPSS